MFNITLQSLTVFSSFLSSPFYIRQSGAQKKAFFVDNCHFNRFYTPMLFSHESYPLAMIKRSKFYHFLDNSLVFLDAACDDNNAYAGNITIECKDNVETLSNQKITSDHFDKTWNRRRPYFNQGHDVEIVDCVFSGCYGEYSGGGLHINLKNRENNAKLTFCFFENCFNEKGVFVTDDKDENGGGGGAYIVCKELQMNGCCFKHCYGGNEELNGVAGFIYTRTTEIKQTACVDCKNQDKENAGKDAQFYIYQTVDSLSIQNVNITGGYASDTGGIHFYQCNCSSFQSSYITFDKVKGSRIVHYNGDDSNERTLEFYTFINNDIKDQLIFVESNSLFIFSKCYFRGEIGDSVKAIKINSGQAKLVDCYFADNYNGKYCEGNYEISNLQNFADDMTIIDIGFFACGGGLTFTPSQTFTLSSFFSSSNDFSESISFTNSEKFSASTEFSESSHFSFSSKFTISITFSFSSVFTKSNEFVYVPPDSSKDNKFDVGAIAGIVIAIIVLVAIIVIIVILYLKKKTSDEELEHEAEMTESSISLRGTNDDPHEMLQDDPFRMDFDENPIRNDPFFSVLTNDYM